jgi:glycosyltransferase involved in cell wall biosynthesis
MKAVHVSIVHPATDVRIFTKQCRTLSDAGYDVVLYARTPNQLEDVGGVRVKPVPQGGNRMVRMTAGVWRLLRPLLAERADIYHLHDPELVPLGLALRAIRRVPVIFDAHEPLPLQIYDKHWIPGPLRPVVSKATQLLVKLTGRSISAIVAASPLAAEAYTGARKIVTVNNYPIVLEGDDYDIPYDKRGRDLVYVGGISEGRGLAQMIEVARRLHERTGGKLTLVGPFQPAALESKVREAGEAIDYLGVLPPAEARRIMAEGKVGLLLFQRSRAHERSMPNKLFEYMASGVPVVASDFPHWGTIIGHRTGTSERRTGLTVAPDDVDAIDRAAQEILADTDRAAEMGRLGREAATTQYTWASEARTLLSLYEELLPSTATSK